jgi:hypothetical protein
MIYGASDLDLHHRCGGIIIRCGGILVNPCGGMIVILCA